MRFGLNTIIILLTWVIVPTMEAFVESSRQELIHQSIIQDMSEGVMTIGLGGVISTVNPAAEKILGRSAKELEGNKFAVAFFGCEENDEFNQAVLDALYDKDAVHEKFVPYFTGKETRQLHVTTSFLHKGDERVGVIVVISDITELAELRDAVKAMERIRRLNGQLEMRNKLLNETFGRFLSDEIVKQLLETPDGLALGGKKRTLTILMSDLRGFTSMSEKMKAQDLISMLNHYLGEMTDVIQANSGTIIEFIGDGILAIFGAPAPSANHEDEGVTAAVQMQMKMVDVNKWNQEHGYPVLEMGIGVNTGEVIVGNIGSEKRTKYGVVGSHVNICGRIESYTVGGEVLISPRTREGISLRLDVSDERNVMPKGVGDPLILSCIDGIGEYSCKTHKEDPVAIARAVDVKFLRIEGKHIESEKNRGRITAISEKEAVLQTEAKLERFENLEMETGGKLLCKVVSKDGDGWRVRFTSVPEGFKDWKKENGIE